jgi:signal transduction histidine kinase
VGTLLYIRLIGFTAGTLLMLFWMVVILGYRRQRNFERVFFFLCLALFLFYSGSLLALNSQIYYAQPPEILNVFSWSVLCLGLCLLPPLLAHLHLEFAEDRGLIQSSTQKRLWLAAFYAPVIFFVLRVYPLLTTETRFDFLTPGNSLGRGFGVWLAAALLFCAYWEKRFASKAPELRQEWFHRLLAGLFAVAAVCTAQLHVFADQFGLRYPSVAPERAWMSSMLVLLPILPLGLLVYYVQRFNFLQIGRQRNLLYAVSVTFFALLYLSLVRRISTWLEPILPPEASAAILLFVLVVFSEPLQRLLGRRLRLTAQAEMDQAQRIAAAIQEVARQGNSDKLRKFVETWLKESLEVADVQLILYDGTTKASGPLVPVEFNTFSIQQMGRTIGGLQVRPHGAMLSGETRAGLEFICEQIPAAFDLCRLIEEKLRLERELAERERMAVLGQMAASISHNLKNPLGSIKTILQVQMESPEMPESLKAETRMVLEEVSRLSQKLGQLLQFSRPTVLGGGTATSDVGEIVNEVSSVMKHEAERKGIQFGVTAESSLGVTASREAVSDIVSNLVVNGLEASGYGGDLRVSAAAVNGDALICVKDDGKGIPPELREKVMQPFFTTKTQGTGLGLAIVSRRVSEAGGRIELESPVANGRGTKFSVWLPLKKGEARK